MSKKIFFILGLSLVLAFGAACGAGVNSDQPVDPKPINNADDPADEPAAEPPSEPSDDPPADSPGGPPVVPLPEPVIVAPSDNMHRGNVYINSAGLAIMESFPIQVMLNLQGDLPTPCNQFRAVVAEPNQKNEIHVEVYSEVPQDKACIQVLEPFEENVSIPMDGQPDGAYSVWVNGVLAGEFNYPGG